MSINSIFSTVLNQLTELDKQVNDLPQFWRGSPEQNRSIQQLSQEIINACKQIHLDLSKTYEWSELEKNGETLKALAERLESVEETTEKIANRGGFSRFRFLFRQKKFANKKTNSKTFDELCNATKALESLKEQSRTQLTDLITLKRSANPRDIERCFGFCMAHIQENLEAGFPTIPTSETMRKAENNQRLHNESVDCYNKNPTGLPIVDVLVPEDSPLLLINVSAEKIGRLRESIISQSKTCQKVLGSDLNEQFILMLAHSKKEKAGHAIHFTLNPPCFRDINQCEYETPELISFDSVEGLASYLDYHIRTKYEDPDYQDFKILRVRVKSQGDPYAPLPHPTHMKTKKTPIGLFQPG